ncbi:hypothetical protein PS903_03741 [Pseudomonas fluorescens]|nr:hypothetical protein PS903_03741 [Pseudomonas fluorescens]
MPTIGGRVEQHVIRCLLERTVQHTFEHAIIALARFERQVIAEQHEALGQFGDLFDNAWQVRQMIAFDLDQPQPRLGVFGQQGAHQGRFAGAARAPEQGVVGRHAVEELLGIAPQLLHLPVDADQVGQPRVEADVQRQQKTAAPFTLPACGQAVCPVDGLPGCGQQRFDTGQHGIGAFKKSIQSGIHVFSSDTFTVMMRYSDPTQRTMSRLALEQGLRRTIGIHA